MPLLTLILLPLLQTAALEPQYAKLPNGIRTCVVADRELGLVSVQVWIRAGTICDPPHRAGLTRLAHEIIRLRGGSDARLHSLGLSTSSDVLEEACYFETLLPSDSIDAKDGGFLDRVLAIRAAQLTEEKPTSPEIERALANVAALTHDVERESERPLRAAMFPNHPYLHPPGFVAATLADASPGDVADHFERWIAPTAVLVLIVGDIEPTQAGALITKHFGKIPWREAARRQDFDNPPAEMIRIAQPKSFDLEMAWLTPSFGRFEAAAVHAAIRRLERVVQLDGCGVGTDELLGARRAGMWSLRVLKNPFVESAESQPSPAALESQVRAALEQIAAAPMAEEDLNRLRAQLSAELGNEGLDFRERALLLGRSEILGGDLLLDEYITARPQRLTVGDVQYGASLLLKARTVIASAGPTAEGAAEGESPTPAALRVPAKVPAPALVDALREPPIALPAQRRGPSIIALDSPQRVERFAAIAASPRTVIAIHAVDPSADAPARRAELGKDAIARLDDLASYRGIERDWHSDRPEYAAPPHELDLAFDMIAREWAAPEPPAGMQFMTGAGRLFGARPADAAATRPAPLLRAGGARRTEPGAKRDLPVLRGGDSHPVVFSLECAVDSLSPMQATFDFEFYRRAVLGEFAWVSTTDGCPWHDTTVRIPLSKADVDRLVARIERFNQNPSLSTQEQAALVAQATVAARLTLSDPRVIARELAYETDPWSQARLDRLSQSDSGELLRDVTARVSAVVVFRAP